jgi:hypothetical protein
MHAQKDRAASGATIYVRDCEVRSDPPCPRLRPVKGYGKNREGSKKGVDGADEPSHRHEEMSK